MLFSVELLNLILYCVQQLGIALGLGAQTIMLVAFASAMRDGVIDEYEAQFLRATRNTLWVALVFIVVSGIGITVLHALAGQGATILTPTYLFKLLLIAAVIALTALLHTLPETFAEGLLGGTWYALFLVHILAPVTTWINLLVLFVVWLVGFNLIWYVIVFSTREKKPAAAVKEKKSIASKSSEAAVLQKTNPPPIPEPAPHAMPQIQLDPVPKVPPVILKETIRPIEFKVPVPTPVTPTAPIVTQPAYPVEKLPGAIATDTPFLPQVPPLLPIPVILPTAQTQTPVPAAGVPKAAGQPPTLQKPEDLPSAQPTVPPETKLGLNVMPKSPDQLKP
jgi:hypothetical protein